MSTLKVNTLQDASGANNVAMSTLSGINSNGIAKAWVNFNQTGTQAIRNSFNVSSVTDNAVAKFTINFTKAFTSGYCVAGIHNNFSDGVSCIGQDGSNTSNTQKFSIMTTVYNGGSDPSAVRVIFIGNS